MFVCLFCLQSALKDSLESLQRSQLGQPGPKKEKERIIRLASKVAPKYTRVKQFLHAALKWSWTSGLDTVQRFASSMWRGGIEGECVITTSYLQDTGHRLWRSRITWSASEAGTHLTPCWHSGPLQSQHPCCKHSQHRSSEIQDYLSLRNHPSGLLMFPTKSVETE